MFTDCGPRLFPLLIPVCLAVSGANAAAPSPGTDAFELQEVVVTAQKRSEKLQDVPIAITVVNADELHDRAFSDSSQLQYISPSLQTQGQQNSNGATSFAVRGICTAVYAPYVEQSVAIVLDGISLAQSQLGIVRLFDIDHIEVLRGPQGTLFGKNASAGVVNIVTNRPQLGTYDGTAHVDLGFGPAPGSGFQTTEEGAFNFPVTSNSAARVSAFFTRNNGEYQNINPGNNDDYGQTEYGVRAKYLWSPSDALDLYLLGDYAHSTGRGVGSYSLRSATPGTLTAQLAAADGIVPGPRNDKIASGGQDRGPFQVGGAQAEADYRFAQDLQVTAIVGYRNFISYQQQDADTLSQNLFDALDGNGVAHQTTAELRIASTSESRLKYVAGLYYFTSRVGLEGYGGGDFVGIVPISPPPGLYLFGGTATTIADSTSRAAFGQVDFAIVPQLTLTLGARETHDSLGVSVETTGADSVFPIFGLHNTTANTTHSNFSYRTGLRYAFTDEIMAYATYTTGYKGPTFNGNPSDEKIVNPEFPTSIELGMKSTLFGRRLQVDMALFTTRVKDFQAQAFDITIPSFVTLNAGELRSKGAELEFIGKPGGGFTVSGGVTFADSHYERFPGNTCYPGEPTGTGGSNVCLPDGTSDASGNQLVMAPRWVGTVRPEYSVPLSDRFDGFVSMDYYYKSGTNFSANGDPQTALGGYGLLGASLGLSDHSGNWRVAFFARNLLDHRFPTNIQENVIDNLSGDSAKGGTYVQSFGLDSFREMGITATARF